MKRILIFSGCLLLFLLIASMHNTPVSGFSDSSRSLLVVSGFSISPGCFASSLISYEQSLKQNHGLNIVESGLWHYIKSHSENFSSSFYMPQMVGWATWIWLPRRPRQPYRNPQRRFRLNKKQRRRLRRRLWNLLQEESTLSTADRHSSSLEWA